MVSYNEMLRQLVCFYEPQDLVSFCVVEGPVFFRVASNGASDHDKSVRGWEPPIYSRVRWMHFPDTVFIGKHAPKVACSELRRTSKVAKHLLDVLEQCSSASAFPDIMQLILIGPVPEFARNPQAPYWRASLPVRKPVRLQDPRLDSILYCCHISQHRGS
jgi:hypothetical protein